MSGRGDRDRDEDGSPSDETERPEDQIDDAGSPAEDEVEDTEEASSEASEVQRVRAEFEQREADIRAMLREERKNRRNNQEHVVRLQRDLDDAKARMEAFEARQSASDVARQDADLAAREAVADREYRAALEAGDTDAIIAAQRKVTDARTERLLASRLQKEEKAEKPEAPQRRDAAPVEQPQQLQLSPLAQRWLASHRWYGNNADVNDMIDTRLAITTFQMLGEKGLTQDDPEMFQYVDEILRDRIPNRYQRPASRAGTAGAGRAAAPGTAARDDLPEMTLKAARLGGFNTSDPKIRQKLARAFAEVKESVGVIR